MQALCPARLLLLIQCRTLTVLLHHPPNHPCLQASPDVASLAADVADTAAALRQWVDTASDKDYLLLHARVEASASR